MQVNKSVPIAGKCGIAVIPLTKICIPLLLYLYPIVQYLCLSTCTITFYLMLNNCTHWRGAGGWKKGRGKVQVRCGRESGPIVHIFKDSMKTIVCTIDNANNSTKVTTI